MKRAFFSNESLSDSRATQAALHIFSFASIILGVFWAAYALANGFRAVGGDPLYFVPQAAGFLVLGAAGWVTFGALARILGRLERLEQTPGQGAGETNLLYK